MISYYVTGTGILLAAILMNWIAYMLKLKTWYIVFMNFSKYGLVKTLSQIDVLSYLFLLIIYPLVLGLTGIGIYRWLFQ